MADSPPKPCRRCKSHNAPYTLRKDPTCQNCYVNYVDLKVAKRLGALHKVIRPSKDLTIRRYLAGLSFGPSSSTLAQILSATAQRLAAKKGASAFEPLIVHVDTDLAYPGAAQTLVAKYQERFPAVTFECVHLSEVLKVRSVDWSTLPLGEGEEGVARLSGLFERLPTVTARADILKLLVRHLLLHIATERGYSALLLGHNATSLAALTLSEVANGRGFAVPWQVNDGFTTICTYEQVTTEDGGPSTQETAQTEFPVYYPLREVFRGEIIQYIEMIPPLEGLIIPEDRGSSVVSHKDLSIDEVMKRYFEGVEENFSGIVSNVVRTTGKLERLSGDGFCGSCGMTLDEQGDSRWAGELGDDPGSAEAVNSQLCYGCRRSIYG